jgi:hypothetical protein
MSCPIIVSKFVGSSCTFGISIDVGIGTKIGADVKMDVGVLFCRMLKLWPSKFSSYHFAIVWASSSVSAPSYATC